MNETYWIYLCVTSHRDVSERVGETHKTNVFLFFRRLKQYCHIPGNRTPHHLVSLCTELFDLQLTAGIKRDVSNLNLSDVTSWCTFSKTVDETHKLIFPSSYLMYSTIVIYRTVLLCNISLVLWTKSEYVGYMMVMILKSLISSRDRANCV